MIEEEDCCSEDCGCDSEEEIAEVDEDSW